jgi:hypothetical protein
MNKYSLLLNKEVKGMPNLDGTGPMSKGPKTGRRSGKCTCPKCGHEEAHKRGVPCSQAECPKCKTPMKGVNCL